ncbi:MAG: hypothetical protein H7122_06055 [Chitinophagaceae bacterium]|nr:hypothetical protein [Chitinophagaceae bacterium]
MRRAAFLLRSLLYALPILFTNTSSGQELYVYTEPASNMPANSISAKINGMFSNDNHSKRTLQRYAPEVMIGLSKKWMVHGIVTFSNMHQDKFIFESSKLYAKWRFFSVDDVHKHFRMAAFGAISYSRNHLNFNEINLSGDQSGAQFGIIATQLWNKLAISASASINEIIHKYRWDKFHSGLHVFESFNYSLSTGYLLLPFEYRDYQQTNLNLYLELLSSTNIGWPQERYYMDLAPAIQLIFNSTDKLNLGYRFQIAGDIYRMANKSLMISYEHIFLNVLRKKKKNRTAHGL